MKLDNRDLVLRGLLGVLPARLEPYTRTLLSDQRPSSRVRSLLTEGAPGQEAPDLADLSTQIRLLTARGADGAHLFALPPGLGPKLHEVRHFRNDVVHGRPFDADRALAALVAASEVLRLAGVEEGRDELRELMGSISGHPLGDQTHEVGSPAAPDPLGAVGVGARCPAVLGYAHAVAGLTPTITFGLRPHESAAGRALPGTVEATLSLIEDGGGHKIAGPWALTWDTSRPELDEAGGLALDRANLLQVEQAGPAHMRVELRAGRQTSIRRIPGATVLAPRQWQRGGGDRWAGSALATFVQPGQPAVEAIARECRELGGAGGGAPGCDALAEAVCTAVRRRRLTIEHRGRPWHAEPHSIRTAAGLLDARTGTALDVAVMLAAVLERLGVAPTLLLTPSSVLLGYPRRVEGGDAGPTSPQAAADFIRSGAMGLIDPVLAARTPAATLDGLTGRARDLALDALSDVVLAVPLDAARAAGAVPQPLLGRDEDDLVVELPAQPLHPLPGPDAAGDAPRPAVASAAPGSGGPQPEGADPAGAPVPPGVEAWKRSLLDLSLRNPLIDRTPRHAITLCVPSGLIGSLEDYINGGDLVGLRPCPRRAADAASADPDEQSALLTEHRAVRIDLTGQDYERRLQSLDAAARTGLEETGANNLYLAVGTLVWWTNGRRLHSPLILIPVTLEREGDAYGIVLDEAGASTPNSSLLARFEADTGIDLTELREPARDEHGIDIETTLERVRARLRSEDSDAGVESTVHLGLFHFSTYRMWRDLAEEWPTITANPLVGRLLEADGAGAPLTDRLDGAASTEEAGEPAGSAVDEVVENLPLAADSTQARVIADAVAGRDLVVVGPPGTGKSQTVANLIFRALARGRTVMFVAEKTSALNVVARRLREEAGIGDLLLNLHDNGMKPAEVRRALARALRLEAPGPGEATAPPDALRRRLAELGERLETYRRGLHAPGEEGASYYAARQALIEARDGGESGEPELARARALFEARARATGLDHFSPADHARLLQDYRRTQEQLRGALTPELLDVVIARREAVLREAGPRADELRRKIDRRTGSSIRELMDSYGDLVTALTPCLLVSPDSVARFLPAHRRYVDIVVFDEASQITVAGAVGAMGRGRSTIVVGDPRQMPPTASPGSGAAAGADLEGDGEGPGESILDRCLAAGVTRRCLSWHYRSRDESLIAFSNRHYYNGSLLSFPSPQAMAARSDDGPGGYGISLRRVGGTYYRPQARARHRRIQPNTNPVEARQIVDEVIRRFEASPDALPSLGVITFNSRQRDLIEAELRERGSARIVEALTARDGLFVRNLENVQGEERDTILFSLTFSANERGDLPLNFGSLSHSGGQRRLNVAITRARRQVVIFTSFDPEDLHAERSTHQGLRDLRAYLEQARDGRAPRALPAYRSAVDLHRNEIAERLRESGLEVSAGVGHSSFEVDLVVSPPGQDPASRIAVLLDGPAWNRRGSIADRDLLPVDVLRSMGWSRVERVWMPEWVADERSVVARLVEAAGGRPAPLEPVSAQAEPDAGPPDGAADSSAIDSATDSTDGVTGDADGSDGAGTADGTTAPADRAAAAAPGGALAPLAPTDYRQWRPEGVRPLDVLDRAATDPQAKAQVVAVARAICDVESPLSRHRLIVTICRAFGLSRTTKVREAKVREALGEAFAYIDDHDFVWRTRDASLLPLSYRKSALDAVGSIEEIHPRELVALMTDIRAKTPWANSEELCAQALRRLSSKRRKLGARGVLPALIAALKEAEEAGRADEAGGGGA